MVAVSSCGFTIYITVTKSLMNLGKHEIGVSPSFNSHFNLDEMKIDILMQKLVNSLTYSFLDGPHLTTLLIASSISKIIITWVQLFKKYSNQEFLIKIHSVYNGVFVPAL